MNAKLLCSLCIAFVVTDQVTAYNASPRWGQATVIINDALFVYGGKTDASNSFGYSAAPNNNDILYLPLSNSFDTSSPPWQIVNTSLDTSSTMGPALSWHTLSAFNTTHIILFGGQPGPNSPTVLVDLPDSAYLLDVTNRLEPLWIMEPVAWANEPTRRVHHSSTSSTSGSVFIIGGEKADGSNIAFSEHYRFDPYMPSFTLLPSDNSPSDITGHSSVILPDGRLLVFGGFSPSSNELLSFSTIWTLDTSRSSSVWISINVSDSSLPSPRRAFPAAVTTNGKVVIHGGSDAVLQSNFDDGWILDTSQNPMVWTQVNALSEIGAQRDHFAVPYGNQVIFCFGYGNDKPASSSVRLFDVESNTFVTSFSPLPPSSTPSQTIPGPSQTSNRATSSGTAASSGRSSTGAHSTSTTGPQPGNPNTGGSDPPNSKTTAAIVGSIMGALGFLFIVLLALYFVRRHRREATGDGRFIALANNHDGDSVHLVGNIPTAGSSDDSRRRRAWNSGIFNTLGLSALATMAARTRNLRSAHARRDMLADEDDNDFSAWYNTRRRGSAGDSSWSLGSMVGSRKRSQEPSVTGSVGGVSWREKADLFSGGTALTKDEGVDHERQNVYSSSGYHDPFADPIQEERLYNRDDDERGGTAVQPYLHAIPQQLSSLRTILPTSQGAYPLTPLTEQTSRTTLTTHDASNSVSSHTSHTSPFEASSSRLNSETSFDPPKSLLTPYSPGSNSSQPIKRSDSWWSRFARTSFLDRRPSESRVMPGFRDPNPPPRLVAIEEGVQSQLPSREGSGSSNHVGVSRHTSRLQGGHNKSLSSVRTADTEAIERIARTMDVAHVIRAESQRTGSTSTSLSIDTRLDSWIYGEYGPSGQEEPDLATFASPVEMIDPGMFSRLPESNNISAASPLQLFPTPLGSVSKDRPLPAEAAAAKIQGLERHQSQDPERPSPFSDTGLHSERTRQPRAQTKPVNYGLIPRANLFIANPDHRTITRSDDS